ncbi:MAG: hypothetical protein ACK58L_00745 [Planctomycetota bacterium]
MRTLCLLLMVGFTTGCQAISHELQPHRLWRWNYYEPTSRDAFGTFSIDDPLNGRGGVSRQSPASSHVDESLADSQLVVAPMPSVKSHE